MSYEHECPINDFVVSHDEDKDFEDRGYSKIQIDWNYFFYFTNDNKDGTFMVDNRLLEKHACIYGSEELSEVRRYPLMNKEKVYACSNLPESQLSTDIRYERKIKYNRESLYDDNYITEKLVRLPGFGRHFLKGEASLFSRGYIHWDEECRLEGSNIKTMEYLYSKISSATNWIWLTMLLLIFLTIANCVSYSKVSKTPLLRYYHVVNAKVVLLFNYLTLSIIFKSQALQNEVKDFIFNFGRDVCSDHITNAVLRETFRLFTTMEGFQSSMLKASKYFIFLLMLFSFFVFCPLIYQMILIKIKLVAIY